MSDIEKVEEMVVNQTSNILTKIDLIADNIATKFFYQNTFLAKPQLLTYVSMIVICITLSVIGSYATVEKCSNALDPNKNHPLFDPTDFDTKLDEETSMTERRAATMPIIGGGVLLALYYGIKNISKETLLYYLKNYTIILSLIANFNTLNYLIKIVARKISYWFNIKLLNYYKLTLSRDEDFKNFGFEEHLFLDDSTESQKIIKEEKLNESRSIIAIKFQLLNFYYSSSELISIPISLISSYLYYKQDSSNWLISNFTAFAFTIFGIQSIRITTFKTGIILLLGLFFYDIYFVFGSNVMETVLLGLDIPLKISVPSGNSSSTDKPMSIIGLGDIVIPTVFISLCLRFDLWKFHDTNKYHEFHHLTRYAKPYFITSLIGYLIGLTITMSVLEFYHVGQPALLYIVPSILISTLITAIYKKDLSKLIQYEEKLQPFDWQQAQDAYKVSKETLRLLDLDSSDDEDDEYIAEGEDTVIIMDQYYDEIASQSSEDEEAELTDDEEIVEINKSSFIGGNEGLTFLTLLNSMMDDDEEEEEDDDYEFNGTARDIEDEYEDEDGDFGLN